MLAAAVVVAIAVVAAPIAVAAANDDDDDGGVAAAAMGVPLVPLLNLRIFLRSADFSAVGAGTGTSLSICYGSRTANPASEVGAYGDRSV